TSTFSQKRTTKEIIMQTLLILSPLLIPLAGVPLTLMTRKRSRLQIFLALTLMFAALGFSLALLYAVLTDGPITLQMGAWQAPFGITFAADPLGVFMLVMSHLVLAAGFLYAAGSTEKVTQYRTFYPLDRKSVV